MRKAKNLPGQSGDPAPGSGEPTPGSGEPAPRSGGPAPKSGDPAPGSGDPAPRSGEPAAKVMVNARYLANPTTGIERVLRAFLDAFRVHREVGGYAPLLRAVPAGEYPDLDSLERGRTFAGPFHKALFDSLLAGVECDRAGARLFFGPSYAVPLRCPVPRVSYAHDLAFMTHPSCYDARTLAFCAAVFLPSVLTAEAVVTNSEATAAEIRALPRMGAERVFVAPPPLGDDYALHAADPALTARLAQEPATGRLLARFGVPGPYVLNVSTIQPRKNQARLVRAFAALPPDPGRNLSLVLAGRPAWKTSEFRRTLESLSPSVRARVFVTGQVSEEEVMRLLSRARCLAYPSLAEGFGIPAIEAMAMGVPVVSGNSPAPLEVCGRAALFADPLDIGSICDAMTAALSDEILREGLSVEGRVRAASFTRERFLSGISGAFRYASCFTRRRWF